MLEPDPFDGASRSTRPAMLRTSVHTLPRDVVEEIKKIPGVSGRNGWIEYPDDCFEIVRGIIPNAPAPIMHRRPLACDPKTVKGWDKLYSWQKEGAVALAEGIKKLLWWPPGGGKSSALLAAVRLLSARKTLILTRALGLGSFLRDTKWCSGLHIVNVRGRGPDFKIEAAYETADALLLNYEVLDGRLSALGPLKFDLMICDEAHFLRAHKYKDYAAWVKAAESLATSITSAGGDVWESTATPVADRRRDLFRQLRIAFPDLRFGNSWQFMTYFCNGRINRYGGLDTQGRSNTEILQARLKYYVDKRTKGQIASELPSLRRERLKVECDVSKLRHPKGIENAIAEAAAIKLDTGIEIAVDRLSGPGKVTIVVNRHREMDRLAKVIVKATKSIKGLQIFSTEGHDGTALPTDKRRVVCDTYFKAKDPALLLATMDSISEAIDLQTTDAAIVLSLPFKPQQVEQLEGRFVRIGGDRPVTIYYPIAVGTYDEVIEERLLSKLSDTEQLDTTTSGGIAATFNDMPSEEEMRSGFDAWMSGVGPIEVEDE